jgi:hypothetical protein
MQLSAVANKPAFALAAIENKLPLTGSGLITWRRLQLRAAQRSPQMSEEKTLGSDVQTRTEQTGGDPFSVVCCSGEGMGYTSRASLERSAHGRLRSGSQG